MADLLDRLVLFIGRFVILTPSQAAAWALWVAHTHALDAADQTPYLSITSPEKRSGKTRILEVSHFLVARPWFTRRVSAAALIRKVQKDHPTLLLDESDAAFNGEKEYAETLRGVLNTGHRANGTASLCVGKSFEVQDFSTFCPKAVAGIGRLPDTVADRAIPIRLQRKTKDESIERFRERKVRPEADPIRARLESWASEAVPLLREAEPELPDELSDRAQEGTEPLLAIADLAGGGWPLRARRALVELYTSSNPEDDSIGIRLLRDCRTIFDQLLDEKPVSSEDVDRVSSARLCSALVSMAESPWPEYSQGRPLTQRNLATLLNPYRILPKSIRFGKTTSKGYYRADFESAWGSYLPLGAPPNVTPAQTNAGAGFPSESIRNTSESVPEEEPENSNAGRACDAVTDLRHEMNERESL